MFLEKKKGIISLALVGCLVFTTEFGTLAANPQSEAQSITINHETQISPLAEAFEQIPEMAELAVDTQEWVGKALPNTDSQMNILKEAEDGSKAAGRMFKNTVLTVEEKGAGAAPVAPVRRAQAPVAAPAPAAAKSAAGGAGSIEVKAGAAGKVFKIEAKVGQAVKKGDAVVIIEAMKMEIPVVAPEDGTVASIDVAVGDAIEAGAVLATLN